jgi:hypothetical protein
MSSIRHVYAGEPVTDLDASVDWCTRRFGRPADSARGRRFLAAEGIEHNAVETYSNGVRHVTVPDHDGSAIAFADESGE